MEYLNNKTDLLYKYRHNVAWFVGFFLLYVIIYGWMSSRLAVGVEETTFAKNYATIFLCNGRWGLFIFQYLFDCESHLPYAAGILSGVFISGALIIQTHLLRIHTYTGKFVYSSLYLGCLQWAFQLRYSNQSHAIALGFLLSSIAIYLLWKQNKILYTFLAVLMLCFAVSTFQTTVIYIAILMLSMELSETLKNKQINVRRFCKIISALFIAIILYYIINKLILTFIDIPKQTLELVKNYQESMISWPKFHALDTEEKLRFLGHFAIANPLKDIAGLSYKGQWIVTLTLLPCFFLILRIIKTPQLKNKILLLLCVVAIFYLPYSLDFLLASNLWLHTELAAPLAVATIWGIAVLNNSHIKNQAIQFSLILLSCYIVTFSASRTAAIARNEYYCYERGKEEMISMYSMGKQLALNNGMSNPNIILFGSPRVIQSDFIVPDVEDTGYMIDEALPYLLYWVNDYILYHRLSNMRAATSQDIEKHHQFVETLPEWPSTDSVKIHEGDIVIRVGKLD